MPTNYEILLTEGLNNNGWILISSEIYYRDWFSKTLFCFVIGLIRVLLTCRGHQFFSN